MHPELLNNSYFLRYYNQWQEDPTSIVFAPIAEYLISYKMYDEALAVCKEGMRSNPDFVIGRLVMAKAYYRKKDYHHAHEELRRVLAVMPDQEKALELKALVEEALGHSALSSPQTVKVPIEQEKQKPRSPAGWETVTMAKIYVSQGHREKARRVFEAILTHNPNDEEAKAGLALLKSEV